MVSAHDVAIHAINWCLEHNIAITHLKLQKLLYYIQGEFSRYRKKRLITEDFYAWQLGPVIPEIYAEYCIFSSFTLPSQPEEQKFSQEDLFVIHYALEKYARIPIWDLVDLSHQQDLWKYNHKIFGDKAIIPYETIREYYEDTNEVVFIS